MSESARSDSDRLRVVYIAGAQHCGSTMLDAILGGAPGARSLGEVGGFHRYLAGAGCDCGRPAAGCNACAQVVEALSSSRRLDRFHTVAPLPLKERRAHWTAVGTARRREYAGLSDDLLAAAALATGASALVDSSKNAGRAGALVHDSRHDVRVIHLIRDGRSYLESKRRRAEAENRRFVPSLAFGAWLGKNVLLWSVLRRRVDPDRYLLCRYEDLIADPARELARIGRFTGLETAGVAAAATGPGLDRMHLFEPERRLDYSHVRLDAKRAASTPTACRHPLYWVGSRFIARRWGYGRTAPPLTPKDSAPS